MYRITLLLCFFSFATQAQNCDVSKPLIVPINKDEWYSKYEISLEKKNTEFELQVVKKPKVDRFSCQIISFSGQYMLLFFANGSVDSLIITQGLLEADYKAKCLIKGTAPFEDKVVEANDDKILKKMLTINVEKIILYIRDSVSGEPLIIDGGINITLNKKQSDALRKAMWCIVNK